MPALRPKEAAVMALWDAGASLATIACNTGMPQARVTAIVCSFDGASDARSNAAAMRRGSAYLLKAIQLTGKRHHSLTEARGLAR